MKIEISFHNNDFFGCSWNGRPLNPGDRPIIFGSLNIAWPDGWTAGMASEYRTKHGLAKSDWPAVLAIAVEAEGNK